MTAERIRLGREKYLVIVTAGKSAELRFRSEVAAKGFMDYAVTTGGARRVRLYLDGELIEDRRRAA